MHPLPKRPRKQRSWTDDEKLIIKTASLAGISVYEVMKDIKRSYKATKAKASQIGYPLLEESK